MTYSIETTPARVVVALIATRALFTNYSDYDVVDNYTVAHDAMTDDEYMESYRPIRAFLEAFA